ncbi:RagB/SusD family nutrient uptake outer membrane protein [Bacteroides sedimenti]|uniref:RagB/SusD family nutrient uptake outer membrane protein n=1 Tax=Bacteroides sedimenti TaxID=2136147 RepID=A0ABM8IGA9_9BACE
MNKYKTLLLSLTSLCLLSGCYDLNKYPYDVVSSGTFWKTELQAKEGMMGVYNVMKNSGAYGTYFGLDCMTDIAVGYDDPSYPTFVLGTTTSRTGLVSTKWQTLYDGVMRANAVIQNIPKVSMSDELKTQYIAEAKFMRALYYFNLLDFFGGVPLYDETVVLDKDFNNLLSPRSSADETRTFILKDLEAAIAGLPVKWADSDYGRATKGAAYSLRGKVHLFNKNYTDAVKDFEEVVLDPSGKGYGYSLYPNYANLFKPVGDQSSEMIFAIQNSGGVGMDYGMPMDFYMGSRSSFGSCWNNVMASTTLADMYETKDGKPFNWNDIVPGFNESATVKDKTFRATLTGDTKSVATYPASKSLLLSMYENRDPRMAQTIILPYTMYKGWVANAPKDCEFVVAKGVNEKNGFIRNNKGWDTYFFRKFVAEYNMDGGINDRAHTPINFPLIRYADVLLMLAECYNELGNQTDAVKYINEVRQRPSTNMPKLNSGPSWLQANTKEEVFKRIVQERAVEFAGEGLRFSDLRRWGLSKQMLNHDEFGFTGTRLFTRQFADRDMLWPIPAVEIETNSALIQNPSWD